MLRLRIGDVVLLPEGLKVRHNQLNELTFIQTPVNVVVESVWPILAGTGGTNHFEDGWMCTARTLNTDGTYNPEGALLTIALSGGFKPEYILPDKPNMVLRRMKRTFVEV